MRCLLDTSALVPFSRGEEGVERQLQDATTLLLPLVVVGEFLAGVQGRPDRRSRDALGWFEGLLEDALLVTPTAGTCRVYADLDQRLRAAGRPIPQNDVWVAATAVELGLPLLTRDAHFAGIPGVRVLGADRGN